MPKRNSKHLTDPGIAKMAKAPKGKRVERYDSGADGLCLRITDRGSKTWCISYHFPDEDGRTKHHRFTIGPWPAIGVAEARETARLVKSQARARIDPKAVREEARDKERVAAKTKTRLTFKAIAENYIALEVPGLKRGSESESLIRKMLMPEWGDRQASKIEPSDLTELTDQLQKDEKPMAARRVYEIATRVFNWAQGRGDIKRSPFEGIKPPVKKIPRQHKLKEHEIKALWPVLIEQGYPFGPLQQLLLLLGQRRSEVAEMRWSEVNSKMREWTIPAERSKNDSEHIVPLPDAAFDILDNLPRFTEGDFIFTTTAGRRPVSGFSKAKLRTDQLLHNQDSPIADWRVHDLRRTCRSEMARLGVPEIVGERVLNHLPKGLAKTYNVHEYLDEKREALAKWAQEIQNWTEPPPDNVVKLEEHG